MMVGGTARKREWHAIEPSFGCDSSHPGLLTCRHLAALAPQGSTWANHGALQPTCVRCNTISTKLEATLRPGSV